MPEERFDWVLVALATLFVVAFLVVVAPAVLEDRFNPATILQGMFENPYAAGVSIDIIATYFVLAAWIVYENQYRGVQHGWVALVFGLVIGVALGLVIYLLIRHRDIGPQTWR